MNRESYDFLYLVFLFKFYLWFLIIWRFIKIPSIHEEFFSTTLLYNKESNGINSTNIDKVVWFSNYELPRNVPFQWIKISLKFLEHYRACSGKERFVSFYIDVFNKTPINYDNITSQARCLLVLLGDEVMFCRCYFSIFVIRW